MTTSLTISKKESLIGKLVFNNGKEVFTTSEIVAKKFGLQHNSVIKLIRKHKSAFEDVETARFEIQRLKTKGSVKEVAILSRTRTMLLITLLRNTEKVVKAKVEFVKQFRLQEKILLGFISQRKEVDWQDRRALTVKSQALKNDVLLEFVNYAKEQGSKSAEKYYMIIAKMENKELFCSTENYKNVKEVLDWRQLITAATSNEIVMKAIQDGMQEKLFYKDIFQKAKKNVMILAKITGVSPIKSMKTIKSEEEIS